MVVTLVRASAFQAIEAGSIPAHRSKLHLLFVRDRMRPRLSPLRATDSSSAEGIQSLAGRGVNPALRKAGPRRKFQPDESSALRE